MRIDNELTRTRNVDVLSKLNRSRIERNGGIAQLGEHLLCKQGVSGSIPLISTKGRDA